MILSRIQKYIIGGLLLLIALNIGYSIYMQNSRDNAITARDAAVSQKDLAVTQYKNEEAARKSAENALKLAKAELEAARQAVITKEAELAVINAQKEATDVELNKALRSNRDWADTPLPAGVRDSIRNKD